jgi:hypothetical protein
MMEGICSSETSGVFRTARRYNPEGRAIQVSHTSWVLYYERLYVDIASVHSYCANDMTQISSIVCSLFNLIKS